MQKRTVPIIGTEEGSVRLAGRLGAFVFDDKGNEVNGSGATDEQRRDYWSMRNGSYVK